MRTGSITTFTSLGLGLLLAVGGCSDGGGDNGNGNGNVAGGGAGIAGGVAGGAPVAGAAGVAGGVAGGAPVAGAPVAGAAGAAGGAGTPVAGAAGEFAAGAGGEAGTPVAGSAGEAGAAGAAGGAGEAGAAGGGGSSSATCDTSGFFDNCMQGGQYWGTEQQAGPCRAGTTVYGVANDFGPYGVRSEYNVGSAFNTGNNVGDFAICPVFIDSFGADPVGSADLKDTHDLDFGLFTVFYPGCMPEGEKFPLITWGNGTCAMPEGYGPLLRYVASYGYIVVAANSVQVGSGAQQRKAIDFMLAENDDPNSKYYQKIDVDNIGAMGHSQGGMGTVAAAADPRIKVVILWNGGTSASKPFLSVSGDRDLGGTPGGMDNAVQASTNPAAWLWYHQVPASVNGSTTGTLAPGHLTLMMESERVNEVAVAWWDMMLKHKEDAKSMFLGASCTLCDSQAYPSMWSPATSGSTTDKSIEYGHNSNLQ